MHNEHETLVGFILVLIWVIAHLLYHYLTNIGELSEEDVLKLASLRRFEDITKLFGTYEIYISSETKKMIKPSGSIYTLDRETSTLPSFCAALFKGKKHEWVMFAMGNGKKMASAWINKGENRSEVSISIPVSILIEKAKENNHDIICHFHNHPNAVLSSSEQDIKSAISLGTECVSMGINYFAFVVGRGQYRQYALWVSELLYPHKEYLQNILSENGKSYGNNYKLNREFKNKNKRYKYLFENYSTNLFNFRPSEVPEKSS